MASSISSEFQRWLGAGTSFLAGYKNDSGSYCISYWYFTNYYLSATIAVFRTKISHMCGRECTIGNTGYTMCIV